MDPDPNLDHNPYLHSEGVSGMGVTVSRMEDHASNLLKIKSFLTLTTPHPLTLTLNLTLSCCVNSQSFFPLLLKKRGKKNVLPFFCDIAKWDFFCLQTRCNSTSSLPLKQASNVNPLWQERVIMFVHAVKGCRQTPSNADDNLRVWFMFVFDKKKCQR